MLETIRYTRPIEIFNYPKQLEFMDAPERYVVVEASAKAGKTTGCIVWLLERALDGYPGDNFWWVAPVRKQAKMAFDRLLRFIGDPAMYKLNKTYLTITLANGAVIFFISGDNADHIFGEDVKAVVIDEATRVKKETWYAIRTTLTKTKGRAKIIGNVKGVNNWVYQLARRAEAGELPNWRYFKITAEDAMKAGVLDPEDVEAARADLPLAVFEELYQVKPHINLGNKFCYAFDETKHVGKAKYYQQIPLYLSFDFNYNPICCSAYQLYHNSIWCLRTFKLPNSNIYNLCDLIKRTYFGAEFWVTGDCVGHHHSGIAINNQNYYRIIENTLKVLHTRMITPRSNPSLSENQVRVNAYLEKYRVQIDPDLAADLISDLKHVEIKPDGTINKDNRDNPHQQADLLDTFRYMCANILPGIFPIPYLDRPGY